MLAFAQFYADCNHRPPKSSAYLVNEKLQLQDRSSALMLAVAVHSGSAQSDFVTRSRKGILMRQSDKNFAGCAGGIKKKQPFNEYN